MKKVSSEGGGRWEEAVWGLAAAGGGGRERQTHTSKCKKKKFPPVWNDSSSSVSRPHLQQHSQEEAAEGKHTHSHIHSDTNLWTADQKASLCIRLDSRCFSHFKRPLTKRVSSPLRIWWYFLTFALFFGPVWAWQRKHFLSFRRG